MAPARRIASHPSAADASAVDEAHDCGPGRGDSC